MPAQQIMSEMWVGLAGAQQMVGGIFACEVQL
jgi:hypothetical protein